MDKLWAPWRMKYIQNVDKCDNGCIFCTKPTASSDNDRENLILLRGRTCFVIMNKYPYNNGHLMIVPYIHTNDPELLDVSIAQELWTLTIMCKKALKTKFHPDGFNIGMNIGRTAGAGIDKHIHQHIVPRWSGDANFMPVIGDTKVISQGLFEAYDILYPCLKDLGRNFLSE